jgi:hypothetical protein
VQAFRIIHAAEDDLPAAVVAAAVEIHRRNVETPHELGGEVEFMVVVADFGDGKAGLVLLEDDAIVHFVLAHRVADSVGRTIPHGMENSDEIVVDSKEGRARHNADSLWDVVVVVAAQPPVSMADDHGLLLKLEVRVRNTDARCSTRRRRCCPSGRSAPAAATAWATRSGGSAARD